jgi:hypothetical protein
MIISNFLLSSLLYSSFICSLFAITVGSSTLKRERGLESLSIDDVVILFRYLNLPEDCEAVIRNKRVDGRVLRQLNSTKDIKDLDLPLQNVKSQVLLSSLDEYRRAGGLSSDILLEEAEILSQVALSKKLDKIENVLTTIRVYGKRDPIVAYQVILYFLNGIACFEIF